MGSTDLIICQSKIETTPGTPLAATAKWMAFTRGQWSADADIVRRRWQRGGMTPANVAFGVRDWASASLEGDATAEDLTMLLDGHVKGGVTGATGTDTTDKVWTYAFPSAPGWTAPKARTLELYDNTQGYRLAGGYFRGIGLSGAYGDGVVKFTADVLGMALTQTAPTSSLADRTVDAFPVSGVDLYIDTLGGTMGATKKSDCLIDWNFTSNNGAHVKHFQGKTAASSINPGTQFDISLALTVEANATGVAEVAAALARTPRMLRLKGVSSTLAGAATVYKSFSIDMIGSYDPPKGWGDRDGNTTQQLTFRPQYDTTWGGYCTITVVNKIAALPDA